MSETTFIESAIVDLLNDKDTVLNLLSLEHWMKVIEQRVEMGFPVLVWN